MRIKLTIITEFEVSPKEYNLDTEENLLQAVRDSFANGEESIFDVLGNFDSTVEINEVT